jgi:hypothetical protein
VDAASPRHLQGKVRTWRYNECRSVDQVQRNIGVVEVLQAKVNGRVRHFNSFLQERHDNLRLTKYSGPKVVSKTKLGLG